MAKMPPRESRKKSTRVKRRRRFAGIHRSTPAKATPPVRGISLPEVPSAAEALEVLMVMVAVTAPVPLTVTLLCDPSEQEASLLSPAGAEASAQVRFTLPVKPPAGVTVMVELPEEPMLAIVTVLPVTVKLAGITAAVTVTAMFAVATVVLPWVAVTASV
jgi:hypothetical protein